MRRATDHGLTSLAALFTVFAIHGCYQSGNILATGDAGGAGMDSGPGPDAGSPWDRPPRLPDGALPPTVDAALPPIDEPDVGPDERPSDDPSASEWTDPPPASGDPCCDVGVVVGIDDPNRIGGFPVVAWDSSAWGVIWADHSSESGSCCFPDGNLAFVRLDADARPRGAPRPIWAFGWPTALTYASGRYALAGQVPGRWANLGVLDRSGALVDVTRIDDSEVEITGLARFPLAHVWVAASTSRGEAQLRAFDDALAPVGEPLDLGRNGRPSGLALVALKSRLVVFRGTNEGVVQTTVTGPALTRTSEGVVLVPSDGWADVAAAAMRDTAVAAVVDGAHLWSVVYDPFTGEVHPPTQVAPSTARGHGVAADPLGGTVGVCYPEFLLGEGVGPYGPIQFALLDPEGAPIGTPVSIGGDGASACAVASAGRDQYVVVFWNPVYPGGGISAARVTVRR